MAFLLYRLGSFAYRRRWWVVSAWLAIMVAVGGSAVAFSGTLSNNFTIPGTESQRVLNQLKEEMPEAVGGMGTIVFQSTDGEFTAEQQNTATAALTDVEGLDGVESVIDPFETAQQLADSREEIENGRAELEAGAQELVDGAAQLDAAQAQLDDQRAQFEAGKTFLPAEQIDATVAQLDAAQAGIDAQRTQLDEGQAELDAARVELERGERLLEATSGVQFVSDDDTTAVASVQFTTAVDAITPETREAVQEAADAATEAGLNVEYSKEIVQDISEIFGPAEVIGLLVAAIVLIVMLGTLVAAGLPLLMAIVGVGVGVGITFALTGVIQMSSISPVLALMLGLAVGIDYSLFIVNRHRTQLLRGMPLQESIARATGTAGNAVLFAGITVIIALAALAVPGLPFLTILGLSAAGTVAVSVLVALTLTPALLGFMGRKVISKRRWKTAHPASEAAADEHTVDDSYAAGRGWGGFVTRKPVLTVLAGVAALGVLALPALELRVGLPDGGSEPTDSTAYQAYTLVGEKFGEGTNGPLLAVGELPQIADEGERTDLQLDVADRLAAIDDVVTAVPAGISDDGRTAIYQVIPAEGPASESTEQLVRDLRAEAASIEDATGVTVSFTGQTAANIDVSAKLMEAMPLYLGIVVGLSLVLLLLVFRSILVPLIATAGFLLSLLASFGATVAIYQWGWLGDFFGVTNPGPILSFLPIILIGVLFGLAMDYQMFLVSGMRESFVHGRPAKEAVRVGFSHGARVVTAAAIIMVSVFAGFVFSHLTMVRPIGFGLAFGVLLDAFIVRMTLIPAAMHLLGRSAWWLPKWLDRILPDVDVEGARLVEQTNDDGARQVPASDPVTTGR
ncbi:MMPL family transporter [Arthrobacter tumbae]|uniref:MMPL family transporter n=1 Tax=Arthrobacter tumbae TaxID=163874 RepID=UPI00195883C3|nr:MMPL family transporter [Arthrobacter tumbae]MBM7780480.1 RND superfamily putative drug exporter [Arthrobacter tumbae]